MDNIIDETGFLKKTIKWLSYNNRFHICIHDMSGILQDSPLLDVLPENKFHYCGFCNCAKTTATGLRFCMKCKYYSIKKAILQKNVYTGQCYMGITEIIKPVIWNDRILCIIYLGNIVVDEHISSIPNRIKRACRITGVNEAQLLEALDTTQIVSCAMLEDCREIVEIIHRHILLEHLNSQRNKQKAEINKPVNTGSRHWVIDLVKNYVSTFYNMDIKLTQLAKLYSFNPQYLCRLFTRETGTNFSDYVNRIRVENAMRLLLTTSEDILDISFQVGFNNVTYFNRLFKKHTGITPSEYRLINK